MVFDIVIINCGSISNDSQVPIKMLDSRVHTVRSVGSHSKTIQVLEMAGDASVLYFPNKLAIVIL